MSPSVEEYREQADGWNEPCCRCGKMAELECAHCDEAVCLKCEKLEHGTDGCDGTWHDLPPDE